MDEEMMAAIRHMVDEFDDICNLSPEEYEELFDAVTVAVERQLGYLNGG